MCVLPSFSFLYIANTNAIWTNIYYLQKTIAMEYGGNGWIYIFKMPLKSNGNRGRSIREWSALTPLHIIEGFATVHNPHIYSYIILNYVCSRNVLLPFAYTPHHHRTQLEKCAAFSVPFVLLWEIITEQGARTRLLCSRYQFDHLKNFIAKRNSALAHWLNVQNNRKVK